MHRRRFLALAVALPGAVALAAPFRPANARTGAGARVVASFSILGDMAREIGGDRIALRVIAGPEANAHGIQPRPSDAEAIRSAALVLRNGLGFEPWLDRLLRAAGRRGGVVTATDGISPRPLEEHGHDHEGALPRHGSLGGRAPDPHAWQDLRLAPVYIRNIAQGLAAADPTGADVYRRNAAAYAARLADLDAWVRREIGAIPQHRRKVVTSHDAFGYFGSAYGVEFLAPQGISTEAEPSAAQVARLIRQVREQGITAVFLENVANPMVLERLAREAGVQVRGRLYADALSAPDGPAPTYEAMFRHNVSLLVPAMRGAA